MYKIKSLNIFNSLLFLMVVLMLGLCLPKGEAHAATSLSTDTWLVKYYSNSSLQGTAITGASTKTVDFNWNDGSPAKGIPVDHFSASFEKNVVIDQSGNYQFNVSADDGVRVIVDGKAIIDSWKPSSFGLRQKSIFLNQGTHDVKIEYYEGIGRARIAFDLKRMPTYATKTVAVHENWGTGSPSGLPADHFSATFDQSRSFTAHDYFLQTLADDGVRVNVDGKSIIDRWGPSDGTVNRAYLGQLSGSHTVKTDYYEATGRASIYSDIVPTGDWLAYYYNNKSLSGQPVNAKVIPASSDGSLNQDSGSGAPAAKVTADHFSASYVTAKHITAGDYIVRGQADDGMKILVDGKVVLSHWADSSFDEKAVRVHIANTNGSDLHWIEVRYYENSGLSKIHVSLEPYKVSSNGWIAEYYPNTSLSGTGVLVGGDHSQYPISKVDYNWGYGSPAAGIPSNYFSATYEKNVVLEKSGNYQFNVSADDGVRVIVDGKTIIDSWKPSSNGLRQKNVSLNQGTHNVKIQYYEGSGRAQIAFNIKWLPTLEAAEAAVHENWGTGSPAGLPADHFYATFDQSRSFVSHDYFLQTLADDGIRVNVDGKSIINRWGPSDGTVNRAYLGQLSGSHSIKTDYYESTGRASIYSDIVPTGDWLAYYYNNKSLSGQPVNADVIPAAADGSLNQDNGSGAPAAKVTADNFSASYVTAKHITAGDYIVRGQADDGMKILVDGKVVLSHWDSGSFHEKAVRIHISNNNGSDLHWIEVQYYENSGLSKIHVSLEPFKVSSNGWIAEYFSNTSLSGNAVVVGGDNSQYTINNIDYNWGYGSPDPRIPANSFSARYERKLHVDGSAVYQFKVNADDGIRLYVDNQLVIDSWKSSSNGIRYYKTDLSAGDHLIKLEYMELSGRAQVGLSFIDKISVYKNTNYSISLDGAVDRQMKLTPQTDEHPAYLNGYIAKSALYKDSNGVWRVKSDSWNLRSCASTDNTKCPVLHVLHQGEYVTITGSATGDGIEWYKINYEMDAWIDAAVSQVKYYMDPLNFSKGSDAYYQFLKLDQSANLNATDVNNKILSGKGILAGRAAAFIKAGQLYNVNEIYLIAHSLLETGNGTSDLATGVCYDPTKGTVVSSCSSSTTAKRVYDMYGIGAYDSNPLIGGAAYAYNEGWFTPDAAIIGGAKFIDSNYIGAGQNTLYKMKWDPQALDSGSYPHQYATDIGWAYKQTFQISNLYSSLDSYTNVYDIPNYQ